MSCPNAQRLMDVLCEICSVEPLMSWKMKSGHQWMMKVVDIWPRTIRAFFFVWHMKVIITQSQSKDPLIANEIAKGKWKLVIMSVSGVHKDTNGCPERPNIGRTGAIWRSREESWFDAVARNTWALRCQSLQTRIVICSRSNTCGRIIRDWEREIWRR